MLNKLADFLKPTLRDIFLAGVAAFVGVLAVNLLPDVEITLPLLKATVIAGAYAAARAAFAEFIRRLGALFSGQASS